MNSNVGKSHLATCNQFIDNACTSVTSLEFSDITVALLKYGRYMDKLDLLAQGVFMQITVIYIVFKHK